jgi:hypothetical protein
MQLDDTFWIRLDLGERILTLSQSALIGAHGLGYHQPMSHALLGQISLAKSFYFGALIIQDSQGLHAGTFPDKQSHLTLSRDITCLVLDFSSFLFLFTELRLVSSSILLEKTLDSSWALYTCLNIGANMVQYREFEAQRRADLEEGKTTTETPNPHAFPSLCTLANGLYVFVHLCPLPKEIAWKSRACCGLLAGGLGIRQKWLKLHELQEKGSS